MCLFKLFTSGTGVASSYANLSEQEKVSSSEKSSNPTGQAWLTNMAAVILFWNTNTADVTSCESGGVCGRAVNTSNSRSGVQAFTPRPSCCFLRQGALLHFVSLHSGV